MFYVSFASFSSALPLLSRPRQFAAIILGTPSRYTPLCLFSSLSPFEIVSPILVQPQDLPIFCGFECAPAGPTGWVLVMVLFKALPLRWGLRVNSSYAPKIANNWLCFSSRWSPEGLLGIPSYTFPVCLLTCFCTPRLSFLIFFSLQT